MTTVSLSLPLSAKRARRSEAVAIDVTEGTTGIRALERDWRALAASARGGAPFLGFGFAEAAALFHEARGERVVTAAVALSGRLACALPMAVSRRNGVRVAVLLGDPLAQYGDALLASDAPPRLPEIALRELARRVEVDVFEFRRVRADAALAGALSRFAPVGADVEAPVLEIGSAGSVDDLLLAIGGAKQNRERARSRRRLGERGAVAFEVRRGGEAVGWIRDAVAMKRAWLAAAGHASAVVDDPETIAAFERAALDPREGEAVVAARLSVAGRAAAFEIGVVRGRRYHAFLGVVAEEFAAASPGKIAMEETFRWCFGEGLDAIDLLPPADPYKRLWSNGSVTVRNHVRPVSLAGEIYAGLWLATLRPWMRAGLDRLPASVRRTVGQAALRAGAR